MTDRNARSAPFRIARPPARASRAACVGGVALAAGLLVLALASIRAGPGARARLAGARESLRRSSSPGAGLYDLLAGRLLGGLYDTVARDVAGSIGGLEAPEVLEVGPGPGDLAVRLARLVPRGRITGLDVDAAMVAIAERKVAAAGVGGRVRFVVGDVSAIPFPDASFDLVVSIFSVHHWPDAAGGFAEVRRVLRPGARGLVFDLPDRWGRFETGAPGLGGSARRGGFDQVAVSPIGWPCRLRVVRRAVLDRD